MARDKRLGPGWSSWGRDVGLGFSYRGRGDVRADLAPVRDDETQLIEWRAIAWRGINRADVVAYVRGDTHWDAAANLEAQLESITNTRSKA